MNKRLSGNRGEALACQYLQNKGFSLLQMNYRSGRYEIDAVMKDGEAIVFLEVKSRSGKGEILGREAVNREKQRHIIKAAQGYLRQHDCFDAFVRFDVAEVDLLTGEVTHIPAAFTA